MYADQCKLMYKTLHTYKYCVIVSTVQMEVFIKQEGNCKYIIHHTYIRHSPRTIMDFA